MSKLSAIFTEIQICLHSNHSRLTISLLAVASFFLTGCGTVDSLELPENSDDIIKPYPVSVALGEINDNILSDDEAFVFKKYLESKDLFYNIVLADPDHLKEYHHCDVIITGDIKRSSVRTVRDSPGWIVGVGTFGFYYLLGFNYKYQEVDVDYNFKVYYEGGKESEDYSFSDQKRYWFGLYGPNVNILKKPELYEPGWNELIFRVCNHLSIEEKAGK